MLHTKTKYWPQLIVAFFISLYIVWFSFLSLHQHQAMLTGGLDLGNVNQSLWNSSQGRFLQMTTMEGQYSRLGLHAEPILLLLVPFYWIIPDPRLLLIIQTVILALGAWPAYKLAIWKLEYPLIGVVMAVVYLFSPIIQGANLFHFHAVTFTATLLLFAVYYMLRGYFWRFVLFAILSAACKEEIPLIILLMGGYIWLFDHDRRGLGVMAGALVWFLVANLLIIPAHSPIGENIHYERYVSVGGGLSGMIKTALTNPLQIWQVATKPDKINYILQLLFPVGYLSLLAPQIFLLSAPSLAVNMLSDYELMYAVDEQHYSTPIWPFIFASAIVGIRVAHDQLKRVSRVSPKFLLAVLVGYVLLLSVANHVLRGRTPLSVTFNLPDISPHHQLAHRFLDQIPPEAVVSAQNPYVAHLSQRPRVYIFPRLDTDTKWLLLDVSGEVAIYPFENWPDYQQAVLPLFEQAEFGLIDAADGYLLFQRGASPQPIPEQFYSFAHADHVPADSQYSAQLGAMSLLGLNTTLYADESLIVKTWWQRNDDSLLNPENNQPMLTLFGTDCPNSFPPLTRKLLLAGWYPPHKWPLDQLVQDRTIFELPPQTDLDCISLKISLPDEDKSAIYRITTNGK
ncbi:DUF2079 domain-containing protein [Anaerolineales bacterium HSG6]|nr:DUF2079 domain-containing protein [Anaerolineales bacterium HSG6]